MNKSKFLAVTALTAATLYASNAAGQQVPVALGEERPSLFRDLVACRPIEDPAKRLACYDERVGAIDTAERKRDVVIVDRKQVQEAKKSLFGLSLPTLHIFSSGGASDKSDKGDDELAEINATVAQASQSSGHWLIVLSDGARWLQADEEYIDPPRAGQPIRIRKGAMGSFLANVNKQVAIRVRRVN